MKYSDAKNLIPSAAHVYVGATQEQIDAVNVQKYVSEFEGVSILGTLEPVAGLTELLLGSVSFG
jgi:hypothetical protein